MATGAVPGVLTLPSAAALRVPAPPGLVLITTDDAAGTAARLVRVLGAGRVYPVAEAGAELRRRRDAVLAAPRDRLRRCRLEAAAARARAQKASAALPPAIAGLDPSALRRAAAAAGEAEQALAAARTALGPRPRLDADAARLAWESQDVVDDERLHVRVALRRGNTNLAWANAGAAVLVVGRLLSEALDPAFVLVAALPLAAVASTAYAAAGSVRRSRAAARRRWAALRANDVSTLAGLAAREARARAWAERARGVEDAEIELAWARQVWASLVDGALPLADAHRAVAELEAVARARAAADAAALAWAEAADALQAAEDGVDSRQPPMVVLDTHPPARARARRGTLERLAADAGNASVVVVVGGAAARAAPVPVVVPAPVAPSGPAAPAPAPAPAADARAPSPPAPPAVNAPGGGAGAAAEVRDRVLAGLARLRSLGAKRRDPSSPRPTPPGG